MNFYGRYEFTKASEPINMEEIVEALAHHPLISMVHEGDCLSEAECTVSGGMQKNQEGLNCHGPFLRRLKLFRGVLHGSLDATKGALIRMSEH